jgi:hypothetical protein
MEKDETDPCGTTARKLLYKHITEHYPDKTENNESILKRIDVARNVVKKIFETKKLQENSKVVCIAHSYYFK